MEMVEMVEGGRGMRKVLKSKFRARVKCTAVT